MVQQHASQTASIVNGTANTSELFDPAPYKSNSLAVTALRTAMKSLNSMVTHTMSNSLATLCNIGNSCYMNSVLYTLRFAPNFTHNLHHLVECLELVLHKANAEKKSLTEHDEHPGQEEQQQQQQQQQQHGTNYKSKAGLPYGQQHPFVDGPELIGGPAWIGKELALAEKHDNGCDKPYRSGDGAAMVSEICFGDSEKCGVANSVGRSCTAYSASNPAYAGDSYSRVRKSETSFSGGNGTKTNRQLVCETLHELYHSLARNEAADTIEPFHAGGLLQAVQRVSSTFEGNQQQDAHEFLMCILDSVRESCQKLNKTLIENPDFLKISSHPSLENASSVKNALEGTADPVTVSAETKSSTQFIGRNIFRRRKESLRSNKSFGGKDGKVNAATVSIQQQQQQQQQQQATVKPVPVANSKATEEGMDKDKLHQPHEPSAAQERLKERIRTLGLNFFCEDFEGVTVSRTRCLSCETVTEQKEIMIDIAIPITSNEVSDALKNPQQFYQDACITQEYFRGDNKYRCEVCSGYTEACRTISFDILPRLLVLQLKRFNGDMEKINSYIPTPFVLQCFCAECLGKADNEKRHVYRLYSVITHVGARMSVGHYIAYTSSLQIPLHYINCVKDRHRRALLAASSLDAQACLPLANGIKTVGISGKGGGGGSSGGDKSASGQLKKLFGSKKTSSSGDISKKLKNNVINRFSPINGIENLQLNTHAAACIEKAVRTGLGDNFYSLRSVDGANMSHAHSSGDFSLSGISETKGGNQANSVTCQSVECCAILTKNIIADDRVGFPHAAPNPGEALLGDNGTRSSSTTAAHHLAPISTGSICEINCAHNHYKLDVSAEDAPQPVAAATVANGHAALFASTLNNQAHHDLAHGSLVDDSLTKQQLTWYMCDDDKIKIMSQLEFEEILSPNRRHVTTPYLLFYARYDIEPKDHNPPNEQSTSPTQHHQPQQYQHKIHKVITKHVPAATKSATISV